METQVLAKEGKASVNVKRTMLDITVLMGGPSSERDVSLVSGAAIAEALANRGHRVTRADISPGDVSALDRKGIDVVFIAMHGQFGESGEVQELCEARGLPYTGSGPAASRLSIDKCAAKEVFRRMGILTPDWVIVERGCDKAARERLLARIGLPAVVKPIDGGSSVDIVIARDAATADGAAAKLADKYGRVMAEKFIAGREFTVGVLGNAALPVLEVIPAREFYDYTAKYADGAGTRYVFDHGLPQQMVQDLQACALEAFRALGCRDMSRIDFMLDAAGRPHVLEINTIPGFTSHSLLPMAAQKAGVSFEELVDRLASMAMAR